MDTIDILDKMIEDEQDSAEQDSAFQGIINLLEQTVTNSAVNSSTKTDFELFYTKAYLK